MKSMIQAGEAFLAHYGVPGMKWGVIRSREQRRADKKRISDDAAKVKEAKSTIKVAGTKALSNKELQDVVTRMQLEANYTRLSSSQKSVGRRFAEKMFGDKQARKNALDLATSNALTTAVRDTAGVGQTIKNTPLDNIGT